MYGYGGGYEGSGAPPGYPMQQSRDSHPKSTSYARGRSSGDSVSGNRSTASGSQRASPVGGARREVAPKTSADTPAAAPQDTSEQPADPSPPQTSARASPTTLADENETERLRQAALTEISPSEVAPIKTAFHFFVMDMREVIRPLAEAEVRKSISAAEGEPLDPYLVNSNLNCRLMKAWEDLNEENRQACMRKEEEDRRRFMEEEEIASRHCATLTARSKSPKTPERRNSSQNTLLSDQHGRATPNPSPTSMATTHPEPSPSPISRLSVTQSGSMDEEKKVDDSVVPSTQSNGVAPSPIKSGGPKSMEANGAASLFASEQQDSDDVAEGSGNKRPSPSKQDEKGGSPPKRNRLEEDIAREASQEKSTSSN